MKADTQIKIRFKFKENEIHGDRVFRAQIISWTKEELKVNCSKLGIVSLNPDDLDIY